jgi:hypothetical protein
MFDATTKPKLSLDMHSGQNLKVSKKIPDPIKCLRSHNLLIQTLLALGSSHLCLKS